MSPITDLTAISFAICLLLAGYSTFLCWSPPNRKTTNNAANLSRDRPGFGPQGIKARRITTLCIWLFHGLLAVLYPSPPMILCQNPANLSQNLFTWSVYTSFWLIILAVAVIVRLLAFKQLGENFTFTLAKPKSFVKTGMYAYVQHPSYSANWLIYISNIALLLRLDGVVGCVLPSLVVRWGMGNGGIGVWQLILATLGVLGIVGVWIRVGDEEIILKRTFGEEWEEYHKRTMRFVPGLF